MNHYIIDGNNLIGKIKNLKVLQKNDKESSRIGLVQLLNNYFSGKKIRATLHFDGYPKTPLNLFKGKIVYSEKYTSDSEIRKEIDNHKNPKLITLISSEHQLINYARANACNVTKSEDFYSEILKTNEIDEEAKKLKILEKEKDTFLKLFNAKN